MPKSMIKVRSEAGRRRDEADEEPVGTLEAEEAEEKEEEERIQMLSGF